MCMNIYKNTCNATRLTKKLANLSNLEYCVNELMYGPNEIKMLINEWSASNASINAFLNKYNVKNNNISKLNTTRVQKVFNKLMIECNYEYWNNDILKYIIKRKLRYNKVINVVGNTKRYVVSIKHHPRNRNKAHQIKAHIIM